MIALIVITIHFLNGMYHATPWGKHVNEGIPEWPPSSWRLLRAIIATWKNTKSEFSEEVVLPILEKLARSLPSYHLPDASISHTRHYMPINNKNPTLVMNTFVILGEKPVQFIWPRTDLLENEIKILEGILENLHYFGRAESWCKSTLSTDALTSNCIPFDDYISGDNELVTVLAPKENIKFIDTSKQKLGKEDLDSITITTKELQDKNYIDPPGGRFVQYTRPQNCFKAKATTRTKITTLNNIAVIRYAVTGSVRPLIKDTLRIGDLTRNACMSVFGRQNDHDASVIFSGKDNNGKPLKDHVHAAYFPTYETQDRHIDHLTIFAPDGFESKELEVLFSLKKLYRYNVADINLVFEGCGKLENFLDVEIFKKSKLWRSATPLILTRHIKSRGKGHKKRLIDSPEEQIANEIQNRYGNSHELKNIKVSENKIVNLNTHDFFRWRSHGSVGNGTAYNVELLFKNAVNGPITLGYASHFGLGMFVPQEGK